MVLLRCLFAHQLSEVSNLWWNGSGWNRASHGSELAFVFGNPTGGPSERNPDGEICIVADESDEGARLATLIPALWTSFAITGTPHGDPSLFTVGGDEADQWPVCGPDATVGDSSNEPMLILGETLVGIERGKKDAE